MIRYLVVCSLFLIASLSSAQEFRGTLQGDVTDPTKAAVSNAAVSLKNADTGIERSMVSDESGHYLFTFVAPGTYTLTIKSPGFKTTVREKVKLSINDSLSVDIEIPLGQSTETVQVTGEVTAVQSESSCPCSSRSTVVLADGVPGWFENE